MPPPASSSSRTSRTPKSPEPDVVIIGGGAAGLATAIFTRRDNPGLSVVVLEGARKPGAKILVSGGTRCNVTNARVSETDFWGGRPSIVRRVLRALPVADTIAFFASIGVNLHEEAGGKLFPDTNRARDVLEALLREAARLGVTLETGARVSALSREASRFRIASSHGDITAARVVLATGGRSLPKSGSDGSGYAFAAALGHTLVPTTPALVPLVFGPSDLPDFSALAGVSHDAELTLWVDGAVAIRLRGNLLWTHLGISGPVALDVSRHWARAALESRPTALTLSVCPGQTFEAVDARLNELQRQRPRARVQTAITASDGVSPSLAAAVVAAILAAAAVDGSTSLSHLSRDRRRRLAHALTACPLPVTGTRGYTVAEATAGGVALDEIDPATMASRVCSGLYLVGEVLDVDGRIGGFNFQWAWSSARAAARGLSRRSPVDGVAG